MADDDSKSLQTDATGFSRKRKSTHAGKGGKLGKRRKSLPQRRGGSAASTKVRDDKKSRRLIRKRVREYNSDDDEEEEENDGNSDEGNSSSGEEEGSEDWNADGEDEKGGSSGDEEGEGEVQKGITKFTEGCRAFRMAFMKIMKKNWSTDPLGPVLSAHKKLVAEKLAEEVAELKVKVDAKKERNMVGEKGHVKPAANFLDSKEKFLISVATKGVVKLFNAVNSAQNRLKVPDPIKLKDAKALAKQRKKAFLSELQKPTQSSKAKHKDEENNEEPGWAPLKDGYMLTNPKLQNWDKMPDSSSMYDSHSLHLNSSDEDC